MNAIHAFGSIIVIALFATSAAAQPKPPATSDCDVVQGLRKPHMPWCSDREGAACHESVETCEKLADTVRSACQTTYQNCYVRFAKVSDQAACSRSMQDFREQLSALSCDWPHQPRVGKCGGKDYVRYEDVVKVGGVTTWRNNNPGALTCFTDREDYGAFETCQSFAIFPSRPTGTSALRKWLVTLREQSIAKEKEGKEELSLYALATHHAPAPNGAKLNAGNDPKAYADKMVAQLSSDRPSEKYSRNTVLSTIDDDEIVSIMRAIIRQEGSINVGAQGDTYDLDDPSKLPSALRSCLKLEKEEAPIEKAL